MADVKKIATRESYGNALVELGKEHDDLIVLDADLAGATKTGIFKKAFPDRHIDCGIAEADMMGIAARVFPPADSFRSRAVLPCLLPDVRLSRSATPSATRISM